MLGQDERTACKRECGAPDYIFSAVHIGVYVNPFLQCVVRRLAVLARLPAGTAA